MDIEQIRQALERELGEGYKTYSPRRDRLLVHCPDGTLLIAADVREYAAIGRALLAAAGEVCPDCEGDGSYIGHCHRCDGSGCASCVDGGVPEQCARCHGTGRLSEPMIPLREAVRVVEEADRVPGWWGYGELIRKKPAIAALQALGGGYET